jgi:hypothetical protein
VAHQVLAQILAGASDHASHIRFHRLGIVVALNGPSSIDGTSQNEGDRTAMAALHRLIKTCKRQIPPARDSYQLARWRSIFHKNQRAPVDNQSLQTTIE